MPIDLLEFGEQFHLKKVLEVDKYSRPVNIRLKRHRLFWDSEFARVRPTIQTFSSFLNLFSASDEKILGFAQRWGILDLSRWRSGESCEEWRRLARVAGAVLRISHEHYKEQKGGPDDWKILYLHSNSLVIHAAYTFFSGPEEHQDKTPPEALEPLRRRYGLRFEKLLIVSIVDEWLERGRVRPTLTLKDGSYHLTLKIESLFGSLAIQLMELLGRLAFASCSHCRKFYPAKRAPKEGQNNFCPECYKAGVPMKRVMHRRKLKRRAEAMKRKRG